MVPSGETELAEANAIGSRATRRPETARHLEFPGSELVPQRMHRNIAVPTHCRLSWCELCKFGGGGAAGAGRREARQACAQWSYRRLRTVALTRRLTGFDGSE